MSSAQTSKAYIVHKKPVSEITEETFKLVTRQLEAPTGAQVLLKTLFLSNDPAQRTWIQQGAEQERAYITLPNEGDIMPARALCQVMQTGPEVTSYKTGDRVVATVGWTQFALVDQSALQPAIQIPGQSDAIALGALGSTGLTAYYGLLQVGKATSQDSCIVVSGAAGATGSMVVQIAKKVLGIEKVIGLAGGKEKCAFVQHIGADVCIDYKNSDWRRQLHAATERKVDLFFDNVGGEILDEMFLLMKRHGRIVQCGLISNYHSMQEGITFKNYFEVIINRLSILGFIVLDALPNAKEYIGEMAQWIKEGKIEIVEGKSETIKEASIEDVPKVWDLLFTGGNSGKLVTKIIH